MVLDEREIDASRGKGERADDNSSDEDSGPGKGLWLGSKSKYAKRRLPKLHHDIR